jgi:hypothetical protein
MLTVGYADCRKLALYAECHYAECPYAECHYVECHYAERHYAECHYTECHYAECHGDDLTKNNILDHHYKKFTVVIVTVS